MSKKDWGIRDLKRQLAGMESKLAKKSLRQGLRAAAKILKSEIQTQAPVAEGKLKRSVKIRSAKRKKNRIGVEVVIEGGRDEGFVGFVEFGKRNQPANPFARRSVEAKRQEALDKIEQSVRAAFESNGG